MMPAARSKPARFRRTLRCSPVATLPRYSLIVPPWVDWDDASGRPSSVCATRGTKPYKRFSISENGAGAARTR